MEYRKITGLDKEASRIVFGTTDFTEYNENVSSLLDEILSLGVNFLDTARVYGGGKTEGVLGQYMEAKKNRSDIILLTKGAHFDFETLENRVTKADILYDIDVSLDQLRTTYADIYLLHRDDTTIHVGEIMEAMQEIIESKKAKVIGVSNWTIPRIEEANAYAKSHGLTPFTVSSPNFGLAEQLTDLWGAGCVTISGPDNKENREWYEANQMPVVAYSSLGRGMFTGKVKSTEPERIGEFMEQISIEAYGGADNFKRLARCEELAAQKGVSVAQIAMSWLLHQKVNTFAVVSTTKASRMASNIEALDIALNESELAYLDLK